MKLTLISALLAASLAAPAAYAVEYQVGVGYGFSEAHDDGIWYQKQTGPYELKTSSPSFSLAITGKPYPWLRLRAAYEYLGQHSTVCDCLSSDAAWEKEVREGKGTSGWPHSTFYTKGDSHAFKFSALPEYRYGNATLFAGGGLALTTTTNEVHVENWHPATDAAHLQWGPAQTLDVSWGRHWSVTPFIEAGVRMGNWEVAGSMTKLDTQKEELYPIIVRYRYAVEARYSF